MADVKKKKSGISRRWILNNFLPISVILIIIVISIFTAIKGYYYNLAEQYVDSQMNTVQNAILRYSTDNTTNFNNEIRNLVQTFSEKDKIELIAITTKGVQSITSSGFATPYDMNMEDYYDAKLSEKGRASNTFELDTGEKVYALTVMLPSVKSDFSALRMITSLENVDNQIWSMVSVIIICLVAVILLVVFSGLFFVNSIVSPIKSIEKTARKFAKGDFSERIEHTSADELGDLCGIINQMADELSQNEQLKNEFISSVSHELRTPLTAIKGWSETLISAPEDTETIKKGMRVIIGETDRLSQMVEELLDFSRIQSGKLTLQMAVMDVLAELGDAVLIYEQRAKELGIKMTYDEPEELSFVYGDKNRIRQVFINIIDNAIKYSDSGDRVRINVYEQAGNIYVFCSDTGIGISNEDLPKIKTRFFKADQTRRGSGIGLAVVDEIISLHHGTFTINSKLGVGTDVMITLPVFKSRFDD